jgi:hypothetical protein
MIGDAGSRLGRARIRWRLASPVWRVVAQAAAAIALAAIAFGFLTTRDDVNETAASILVALVFGVATVVQLRQAQRRQHTVGLITAFQSTEVLAAADTWMATRISTRRRVDAEIAAGDERHVISMLDYYEFLATLAMRGLIDVPLLLDLRGGAMARCLDICRAYIADRREHVAPGLYGCFELFVSEYSRRAGRGQPPVGTRPPDRAGDATAGGRDATPGTAPAPGLADVTHAPRG